MSSLQSKIAIFGIELLGWKEDVRDEAAFRARVLKKQSESSYLPPASLQRHRVKERSFEQWPCYTISPTHDPESLHILYLHGGAYIAQIQKEHWRFAARLVDTLRCTITVPIYPLAPGAGHDDIFPTLARMYGEIASSGAATRIALVGDSAGAGMALALAHYLKFKNLPQPQHSVLISPWLDITMENPEIAAAEAQDPWLSRSYLAAAGRLYAHDNDPRDYLMSPLYGELKDLSPLTLFIGTRDILLPDARRFKALAEKAGAQLNYFEYKNLVHVWPLISWLPEAEQTLKQIAQLLTKK